MSCIVYQINKKTGEKYAYESISYWDKEKKQPRSKRKYIGKVDPITGEIIKSRKDSAPLPHADTTDIHFHMLRKTRAMDLYQAGCPLSYIQQLLGHENVSTTSGFYAFATLKTLADSIEKTNPSGPEQKNWKNETVLKQLYRL